MNAFASNGRFATFTGFFRKISNVGLYVALDYFFDFPLYYFMVRQFGLVIGGGVTTLFGLLIDLAIFRWYASKGEDAFGLEKIKEYKEYSGLSKKRLWIAKWMKRSEFFTMCVIAFFSNPCLTLIYVRRRNEADRKRMNLKDWLVFGFSMAIELIWALIIWGAVWIERSVLQPLWSYLFN